MSGGSLDYLYLNNADEMFTNESLRNLKMAINLLEELGHENSKAYKDAVEIYNCIDKAMNFVHDNMEKMQGVLRAAEWNISGDWGAEEVAKAVKEHK